MARPSLKQQSSNKARKPLCKPHLSGAGWRGTLTSYAVGRPPSQHPPSQHPYTGIGVSVAVCQSTGRIPGRPVGDGASGVSVIFGDGGWRIPTARSLATHSATGPLIQRDPTTYRPSCAEDPEVYLAAVAGHLLGEDRRRNGVNGFGYELFPVTLPQCG
ncbi:uncharacterized protein BDZ83DRAFT_649851 [Colletotrichum acutatum]|uniref:Uncharacterized protein n=1 Tax=Glomerella acutata TaxID=27357 RepID=A0AAD8XJN3_GLOAC|nr:uncharacterized protein BDZ83DRAFT_649851 [Colletotrichum acutatum]KAK1727005.1 hypothetical protein BDZ83DRAFT_649851 [Colletotrichum acutatum]